MKSLATFLTILLMAAATAVAQPTISYIIPDIGAPGMNTYVEIISPNGLTGNFGTSDGLFIGSATDNVRVEPANLADTTRIFIGPIVISWSRRLISTQIFVKPGAATGTVPLRVRVGASSTTVNFEIVAPQVLGPLSGGGAIGSGGALGTRSKRGAMIVQDLVLNSGAFTISTNDPDATTAGNQGYLPFILLAKGAITVNSGASLDVNSGSPNAAAGGGGGAGGHCDYFSTSPGRGSNGGNGYTGGGAGGQNFIVGGGSYRAPGTGTGLYGMSMNNTPGGDDSLSCWESSGGGTGHPFGRSGERKCGPSPVGQYGAGSGSDQSGSGGGAGYAANGGPGNNTPGNYGRIHGNREGVPVAGGSGGGGGNPQGSSVCAGEGGGGGGAIALYSTTGFTVANGVFRARGGNGNNGNPGGGAGSGGYIGLGSKYPNVAGGTGHDVAGGTAPGGNGTGGAGRGRGDGFLNGLPTFSGTNATSYTGITIDTLTYTDSRTFTVRGTYDGANSIRIYMRHENGSWAFFGPSTINGRVWTLDVSLLPAANYPVGNYYFVAMQQVSSPSAGTYDADPQWVMSQAAANMVVLAQVPKFNGQDSLVFKTDILCERELLDSVKVWNEGDANLIITNMTIAPNGPVEFSIVSPTSLTVLPKDTAYIVIRFARTTPGIKYDTLVIPHNDNRAILLSGKPRNPWRVVLKGKQLNIQPSFNKLLHDFGSLCKDSLALTSFSFMYSGDVAGSVKSITRLGTGPNVFQVTDPLPAVLPKTLPLSGGAITIAISFRPTSGGAFADSFRVVTGPCDSPFVLVVRGGGIETKAQVTPDPLDFGDVRVGTTSAPLKARITNIGVYPGTIIKVYMKSGSPPFAITNAAALGGSTLGPAAFAEADVTFSPTTTGTANGELCVIFGTPGLCVDTTCITVTGRGVTSDLKLSRNAITLDADPCIASGQTLTDTFQLYNRGDVAEGIQGWSVTPNDPSVLVTPSQTLPTSLGKDGVITFTVTWTPGATSPGQVTIAIATLAQPPQESLPVTLTLTRPLSVVDLRAEDNGPAPSEFEFLERWQCTNPAQTLTLKAHNGGTVNETFTVSLAREAAGDDQGFSVTPTGQNPVAQGGQDLEIKVTFDQTTPSLTPYRDTLIVHSELCGQEFRIPLRGSTYEASFTVTPDPVTFGPSNVGFTRKSSVTVTNTSIAPNNIKLNLNGTINPAGSAFRFDPAQTFPISLAPGEQPSIDIEFTPTQEIPYQADICFSTDNGLPCPITNCVKVDGTGIKSNILIRNSTINFGTLYLCEITSDSIVIENTGTASVDVNSMILGGQDAVAFEQLTTVNFPFTIQPGDSLIVRYRFVPGNSPNDGSKTATVTVVTSDAAQPTIIVTLVGERRTQLLATPLQLNFGRVLVGTSADLPLILENRSPSPLRLDDLILPPPFEVIGFVGPKDIPANSSITVIVRFTPTDTNYIAATLIAPQSSPCIDTTRIPVSGQGKIILQGVAEIDISDSLRGMPGDHISIPILLRDGRLLAESEATTFTATIRFNKTMLLPTGVRDGSTGLTKAVTGAAIQSGSITSSTIVGNDRIVTMSITNSPMPFAPDTLGFLDAVVLLGSDTVTSITIDTLFFTDGDVTVTAEDGIFTLDGYCVIGGDRLVQVNGTFGIKMASPNPFNPSTQILFETVEDGPTTLAVFNAFGQQMETLIDGASLPVGVHARVWNGEKAASGVYYAVLTTPTQRSVYRMVLVK